MQHNVCRGALPLGRWECGESPKGRARVDKQASHIFPFREI